MADLPSLDDILYISELSLGNYRTKILIGAKKNAGLGLRVCPRIDQLVGV
jgi:hypothetical protein